MDTGEATGGRKTHVAVPLGQGAVLDAVLALPAGAGGVVVLFSAAGSAAAGVLADDVTPALHGAGLGTLRAGAEAPAGKDYRFVAAAMSDRLTAAVDWLARDPRTRELRIGCMARDTAVAAAVWTAASRSAVRALALVEGRPDLAGSAVDALRTPTLLVVAGLDMALLQVNHRVLRRLHGPAMLEVIPGALPGLREPDERAMAVQRIADWFGTHLGTREPARWRTAPGAAEHPLILTS